ncbi:MAG: tetratricopeptide repeat protein [Thermoanaerobaculia bacterium]
MRNESKRADDHLPPPPEARETHGSGSHPGARPAGSTAWGDRVLFGVAGLVLGFAAAYVYLEKVPTAVPAAEDPHAGVAGVGPGASRDLPGSGGGAPAISMDPALKQRVAELQDAVAKAPTDYELLVKLGNAAYDADDPRVAVDSYEKALKIKGSDVNVLTDLGVSYRNLGDAEKALDCFKRALTLDPKHWPAAFNEALILGVDKGETKKAQEILVRLRKEHPEIPSLERLQTALAEQTKK